MMSLNRIFEFHYKITRRPYIEYLIDYDISDEKGTIYFGGYYYVSDDEFPIRIFFLTTLFDDDQAETNSGATNKILEEKYYEIEIYDRQKIQNTSEWDEVDEEDGSKARICYFPTHEQKIHFKVIKEFSSFEDYLKRATEYFSEEGGR